MAFPPELTQKPRSTAAASTKYELFFCYFSMGCKNPARFLRLFGKLFGLSKLMPLLDGHMTSYRTAPETSPDHRSG
jgi:hypothetical protein